MFSNIYKRADIAITEQNKGKIESLIEEINILLKRDIVCEDKVLFYYSLGNLFSSLSRLKRENISTWSNDDPAFPRALSNSINSFRKAKKIAFQSEKKSLLPLSQINTNLANELAHQRRTIEAFEGWRPSLDFTIEGDPPYVSSLSMGKELIFMSGYLNDPDYTTLFQYQAYLIYRDLKLNIKNSDHPQIIKFVEENSDFKKLLVEGDESFHVLEGWDKKKTEDNYSREEQQYREWSLNNRLFLNHLNDITDTWIADQDILQFPNHIVNIGDGPYYNAAFSSIKREYCFARYLLYEGIHQIHPKFENDKLYYTNTFDGVCYEGSTEKIKTSLRVCFGVLDSLATLMNEYFKCGSDRPSFSSGWFKSNFSKNNNFFIDALYWLSCDLTNLSDKKREKWQGPNPDLSDIRILRNKIEHGWLRVITTDCCSKVWKEDKDFAHLITLEELSDGALSTLKIVRSALIYFCLSVTYNERERGASSFVQQEVPTFLDDF
ncbi:MAG: LA2681 family HEPN domain-containing protein [Alphaproteobacteria bacterium]